jgi:thiol:disulfide interchange protein DsbD
MIALAGPATADGSKAGSFSLDSHLGTKAADIKPQDVVTWAPLEALEQADNSVQALIRLSLKQDWKVYASNLTFSGPAGMKLEKIDPPAARKFMDPISGKEVDVYEGGEFRLTFSGVPRWTQATFPVSARYVGCTNVICLFPYTEIVNVPYAAFTATAGKKQGALDTVPEDADILAPATGQEEDFESKMAARMAAGNIPFFLLLGMVFLGGLLSNLTPCVYPMIPITLRLLGRQGSSPYLSSSFYALGIVVSYSTLGLAASFSGGMFGALMATKSFNITFAVLMFILGVTMLGFGDFSKIQMLGNKLGAGAPSLRNTFFMGTGAGLVAAPCTGPILAALLAYTTKNNIGLAASTALLFTYSLGFGLPYVFMGGAAAKVGKIKVPPQIQIAVKFLFAVVMFALSFYYLRIPFYGLLDSLRGNWNTIGLYSGVAGLALTIIWLAAANLRNSKAFSLIPSILLGVFVFSLSQSLTSKSGTAATAAGHVTWLRSEESAFIEAKNTGKPILIDMWAEWCEACKKMDTSTFVDPHVLRELSERWITLKLDLTESNDVNDAIQEKYGLQGLPTLVLVPPSGEIGARQNLAGYVPAATLLTQLKEFTKKAE